MEYAMSYQHEIMPYNTREKEIIIINSFSNKLGPQTGGPKSKVFLVQCKTLNAWFIHFFLEARFCSVSQTTAFPWNVAPFLPPHMVIFLQKHRRKIKPTVCSFPGGNPSASNYRRGSPWKNQKLFSSSSAEWALTYLP